MRTCWFFVTRQHQRNYKHRSMCVWKKRESLALRSLFRTSSSPERCGYISCAYLIGYRSGLLMDGPKLDSFMSADRSSTLVSLLLWDGRDPSAGVEVASADVSQLTPDLQMASAGGNKAAAAAAAEAPRAACFCSV